MYNVIKATEAGVTGEVGRLRDYILPRPGHHHDCCSTARFHTNRASSQWRHRIPTCATAGYSRFLTATAADHTPALRQVLAGIGHHRLTAGQMAAA